MDAVGIVLIAVGGLLLYSAVKGEHPLAGFRRTAQTGKLGG